MFRGERCRDNRRRGVAFGVSSHGHGIPFGPGTAGFQAYRRIQALIRSEPDAAWGQLTRVTAQIDDAGLYWVGDLLEDFIAHHGWAYVHRMEAELRRSDRFRRAFGSVMASFITDDESLIDRLITLRDRIESKDIPIDET
jgi:hypothetical protein